MLFLFIIWWLVLFASLAVLIRSSGWLITAAEQIGASFRLPQTLVGLTIVAIGTSLPELASSLSGVFQGVPDIVIGNIVGSNIANVLFVLGVLILFSPTLKISPRFFTATLLLISTTALFFFFVIDGSFSTMEGVFSLIALIFVLFVLFKQQSFFEEKKKTKKFSWHTARLFSLSIVLLGISAYGVVLAISSLAILHQVSNTLITTTAVALGTSLPELVVSLIALSRKEVGLSLGNLVGSNIFNLLFVAAIPSLFVALPVDSFISSFALPVMLFSTGTSCPLSFSKTM